MNQRMKLFASAAVVMLVAFSLAAMLYTSDEASSRALGADSDSPTTGSPEAKVHIVEFLDPACEACRAFFPHVKKILADNRGKVRLTVRHVPFHRGADYPTKVLEATRAQGKYWQALEALLASQRDWTRNHVVQPELVWKPLEGLGIDLDRVKAEMNSPEIAKRIERDLRDAKALNVSRTPEFFVDGRRLPKFGLEPLQGQVKEALRRHY